MTNNRRVINLSRPGYRLKHSRAQRAVDECACTWVEYGVSVRDLTLTESIAARNAQAALRDPLPCAEIPGVIFRQPRGHEGDTRGEMILAEQAATLVYDLR